jgi:hypothetical protein
MHSSRSSTVSNDGYSHCTEMHWFSPIEVKT